MHVPHFLKEFDQEQQPMSSAAAAGSSSATPGMTAAERSMHLQQQVAGVVGRVLGSGESKIFVVATLPAGEAAATWR